MAKMSARGWSFEIRAADGVTWLPILGIKKWEENRSENGALTETTDFQSAGQWEGQKMQVGGKLKLEGFGDFDASGVQSAGQARVEAMHSQLGSTSVARLRFRHSTQMTYVVWDCLIELGNRGGENNDMTAWEAEFTRTGAATTM